MTDALQTLLSDQQSQDQKKAIDRLPLEMRKAGLALLLFKLAPGIALNEHYVGDGDIVYRQACKLGCEGIVSKRLGSAYRFGRSKQWIKVKNPAAPGGTARGGRGVAFSRAQVNLGANCAALPAA